MYLKIDKVGKVGKVGKGSKIEQIGTYHGAYKKMNFIEKSPIKFRDADITDETLGGWRSQEPAAPQTQSWNYVGGEGATEVDRLADFAMQRSERTEYLLVRSADS